MDYNKAIIKAPSADLTVVPSFAVMLLIRHNKILNPEKNDGKIHLKALLQRSFVFVSMSKAFKYAAVFVINLEFFL